MLNKVKPVLFVFVLLLACSLTKSYTADKSNTLNGNTEYVVLLHGLFKNSKQMYKLEKYLKKQGYQTLNISYPSTKKTIQENANHVWSKIQTEAESGNKVHFIGFSMGGLVTRALLSKQKPKNMGRVVLIATPNKGSEVADFFADIWLYKKLTGPAGQELTTNQKTNIFKPVDYELGVIAGDFSFDIFSSLLIDGKDDGKVSIENAKVDGMKDYIITSTSHIVGPKNKTNILQAIYFLQHGKFSNNIE